MCARPWVQVEEWPEDEEEEELGEEEEEELEADGDEEVIEEGGSEEPAEVSDPTVLCAALVLRGATVKRAGWGPDSQKPAEYVAPAKTGDLFFYRVELCSRQKGTTDSSLDEYKKPPK